MDLSRLALFSQSVHGICLIVSRDIRDFTFLFFFNDTATTEIYTLSLHDALPICHHQDTPSAIGCVIQPNKLLRGLLQLGRERDRKSTRLNSSHANISYAVFCLKKKKNKTKT